MLQQHTRTTRGLGPVVALGLAIASLVTASVIGLISLVDGAAAHDFPDTVD